MSDDDTTGEAPVSWSPPTGDPAETRAVAPTVPGLAPLAAGTTAGWYRTAVDRELRYWDGVGWTDQTTRGEQPKATYGQRFRRRFWVVLLVVAGLEVPVALITLVSTRGEDNTRGNAYVVGTAVGAIIGMVLLALVVSLLVAIVPGAEKLDPRSGLPSRSRLKPWAILAVLVAAPIFTYSNFHTTPVEVAPIATTKDGCQAYLDTVETIMKENGSEARIKQSLQALHDAAVTNDPALAADLVPEIANPNGETTAAATKAILTRCVQNGDLTQTEIQDWAARVQAQLTKLQGG